MSSDSDRKKPDSTEPAPASARGQRSSARVPSTWGAARDALAAVFNLEALLRNKAITSSTLLDLLPELRASAALLHGAFHPEVAGDAVGSSVCAHADLRLADLDALLDAIQQGAADRGSLATRAGALADDLEASADLLALLERSGAPGPTEVSLALVAREAARMPGAWRGRERVVKLDEGPVDRQVAADPVVLGSLLSLVVACVHEAGGDDLVVRVVSEPEPGFVVEAASEADAALPELPMRVLPWVPPGEPVARRVAANIGAEVQLTAGRGTITLRGVAR